MFDWLKKKINFFGSVFFRGTWPLRSDEFNFLKTLGFVLEDGPEKENAVWSLNLEHPQWGKGNLICFRNFPLPPHTLIDWDPAITENERKEIKSCGTALGLIVEPKSGNVLRDRKNAFQFMRAIMGEEGLAGMDHLSGRFWPKAALELELGHDADLDIESLITLHAVSDQSTEQKRVIWLHSHGLAEIGFFDFDILRPSPAVFAEARDILRAIAFAILEEQLKIDGTGVLLCSGKPQFRAVGVSVFNSRAGAQEVAIRDDPEGNHDTNRAIICDTQTGFFSRFGRSVALSRTLESLEDQGILIQFSDEATELMSLRARGTYSLLRTVSEELSEFSLRPIVKLKYLVDGAKKDDEAEHLWFEVHRFFDGEIDATLLNEPFRIAAMKAGLRAMHPVSKLTDWQFMGGPEPITPRRTNLLRYIRENKEALRAAAKAAPKNS